MNKLDVKKGVIIVLAILCPLSILISYTNTVDFPFGRSVKIAILFVSVLLCVGTIVFYFLQYAKTYKISLIVNVMLAVVIIMYLWLYSRNLVYIFSSVQEFRKFILSTGSSGVLVYILIQLLQVVLLPIPAAVICLAGALIYGPLLGSIYCSIGVILGSIISFWLGRVFGYRLVSWVAGKDNALKYATVLSSKGKTFLPLAFLLPLFPDDILCLIAGITNIKFKFFVWVTIIFRPISVISMAYFGGGYIIPFKGFGLYLWGAIIAIMVVVVYIVTKYQDNIENWIISKLKK